MQNTVKHFTTPQVELIHRGKVRDSFRLSKNKRMLVASDRISAFDKILPVTIPHKGEVLNKLSQFWFAQTSAIVDNHFLKALAPNISMVKEAQAIPLEFIVRGYLTGSIFRKYKN